MPECLSALGFHKQLAATLWHPAKALSDVGIEHAIGLPGGKKSLNDRKVAQLLQHSTYSVAKFKKLFTELSDVWKEVCASKEGRQPPKKPKAGPSKAAAEGDGSDDEPDDHENVEMVAHQATEADKKMVRSIIELAPPWACTARNNESCAIVGALCMEVLHVKSVRAELMTMGENMNSLRRGIKHVLDAYTVGGNFEFCDGLNGLKALPASELEKCKTTRGKRSVVLAIETFVDQIAKVNRSSLVSQTSEELPQIVTLTLEYLKV